MNLPDDFADECWQMRERFDWAAELGDAIDVHPLRFEFPHLTGLYRSLSCRRRTPI